MLRGHLFFLNSPPRATGRCSGRIVAAFVAILALIAAQTRAKAEATQCKAGQAVIDDRNNPGVIVSGNAGSCLVRYNDRQTQAWIEADLLRVVPATPYQDAPAADTTLASPGGVAVLRPPPVTNRLAYRADALGHVILSGNVNGAPVKFLVDTGATLVVLSPDDAASAGLKRRDLSFDQTVQTANGPAQAAFASLREVRLGELEVDNVSAAVIEGLKQSVLGMSFLKRLKSFGMRDGALILEW